jgi:outer membrane lipoprotein LolB
MAWSQQGERSTLDLRAPLGFGAAHVVNDAQGLQVEAGQGQRYAGASARDELTRRLGFEPPLQSLRYWLLGVPDPASAAAETFSADGLSLLAIEQGGWQVQVQDYARYGNTALAASLPRRLSLQRDGVRVKLVIDQWTLP